jgi:hypothetical protein
MHTATVTAGSCSMPSVKRLTSALLPAFALFLLLAGSAFGANRIREVGGYPELPFPKAGCPTSCQAVGHVTGYQVQVGSAKNPYLIKRAGKIVAFTIRLGKPDAQQTTFFANLFGGTPQARLTLLKKPKKDKKRTNDLQVVGQSELFDLSTYLGSSPTFALAKPLDVQPGTIVALTVPTWVPSFTINLGADQAWRSSRAKNDCDGTSQASQQTVNSVHSYDCFYRTARLLYSATFVPAPKPTTTPPKSASARR